MAFNCVLLLLSVWATLALGANFEFTSNFSSKTITNNGWEYAAIDLIDFNLGLWLGANYLSVDVAANNVTNTVSADVVIGSAYVAITGFPFSWLSYFDTNASVTLGSGKVFAGADVSASAGYVGSAYLFLTETTPAGDVAAVRSLEWTLLSSGLTYTISGSSTDSSTGLQYVTFRGTSNNGDDLAVEFTFLVSSVAGIVNKAIPIAPKSVESVVNITGYPYASPANSLTLTLGVGTGGATVSASGRTVQSTGNSVYFSLANNAVVGGSTKPVKVSAFTSGDATATVGNSEFTTQLSAKYAAAASFKLVNVTFPAGASNIIYDPSQGTGISVHESSASIPMVSLVLIASAVLLALF